MLVRAVSFHSAEARAKLLLRRKEVESRVWLHHVVAKILCRSSWDLPRGESAEACRSDRFQFT